mgnify:FL=1
MSLPHYEHLHQRRPYPELAFLLTLVALFLLWWFLT